ncbi:hypothetical protein [Rhizohabitans arisaemae]|uniref:hypothetical protein n=1 Tax=Rhizohabitans arisaemae TaxID=2720610 RepID=UPI0024B12A5A|nr:hypothetical protein [Rhizohabitans arisaemae]
MDFADIAMIAAVFGGALIQRVTGMGFGLVAAPGLVLAAGPYDGVLLINVLGVLVNVTIVAARGPVTAGREWAMARSHRRDRPELPSPSPEGIPGGFPRATPPIRAGGRRR